MDLQKIVDEILSIDPKVLIRNLKSYNFNEIKYLIRCIFRKQFNIIIEAWCLAAPSYKIFIPILSKLPYTSYD